MPALSALLNYIGMYLNRIIMLQINNKIGLVWAIYSGSGVPPITYDTLYIELIRPRAHVQERATDRPEDLGEGDGEGLAGAGEHGRLRDVCRQGRFLFYLFVGRCSLFLIMFVFKAAEFFSRDVPVKFSQEDMPYFRKRMIWEIINSTLVSP